MLMSQTITSFSREPVTFITEMENMFNSIQIKENRQTALTTLEKFSPLWLEGVFTPEQQQIIIETSDLMVLRNLRPFPDFEQFLQALLFFCNKTSNASNLNVWLSALTKMLENNRNTGLFKDFIGFTNPFLESGILYQSRILTWTTGDADFRFIDDSIFCVHFEKADLSCFTRNDTAIVYRTSGYYFPKRLYWEGYGGKITWTRAGFHESEVYATLKEYNIHLRSSTFEAFPVDFFYKKYFPGPLSGKLTERISTNPVSPETALYPQFESDTKDLHISDIFKEVDYAGGFNLKGAKIIGSGNATYPAILTFRRPYRDKTGNYDLLTVRSDEFIIYPDRISSDIAAVSIAHQDDSIVHSGLQFRYLDQNREISLLRINKGIEQSPYANSFHKLEMDSESLRWRMGEDVITMGAIQGLQTTSTATFVSDKFYSEAEFDRLQGLDRIHPLITLHNFSKEFKTRTFSISQMADYLRMPEHQVELQIIRLATMGFLKYDIRQKQATITDKVKHFLQAKNQKTDYDVIRFYSEVNDGINAELKLENFDLTIRGVPEVSISTAKKVFISPSNQEVTLRKNRDFLFSGLVQAGLFEFKTTDSYFSYDSFRLNMPTVDTMHFRVRSFDADQFGQRRLVDVKTVISGISGEMLIDQPTNKSGLSESPEFPVFRSNTESYIYFDHTPELKDAYHRDRFFYYVKPFTLKSLENFETESLKLEGYLNSGGIFPDELNEPLRVMADYSLGFTTRAPDNGYPVYGGKGTFYEDISLSMNGLKGSGRLNFLHAVSKSPEFNFFLDSLNARQVEFDLPEKVTENIQFPQVKGFNLKQHCDPYDDIMTVETTESPLALFNGQALLEGSLTLTPTELTGGGRMDFLNASAFSGRFKFFSDAFQSDTTKLVLKDADELKVIFNTENYQSFIDLKTKIGNFKANDPYSKIDFPLIRYVSYLNEFDWYFDKNEVELYSHANLQIPDSDTLELADLINSTLPGAKYISTHPKQDSLYFYSPQARYNISENMLTASGVKLIKVADAAIFPGDGMVEITGNAAIKPLTGATIIADTSNRNHVITEAEINIESGYAYKAKGNYAFVNSLGEIQTVHFGHITVDTSYQTIASGEVTVEDHFELSPRFAFSGSVELNARDPLLNFDGSFKIIQDCDSSLSRWVNFRQRIDPDNLILPVADTISEKGYKQLYAGFFHSNEENRVYPAFLSRRSYYSDSLLFSVSGVLKTLKNGSALIIENNNQSQQDESQKTNPSYLKWDVDQCMISGKGRFTFGQDLGQVKLTLFGQVDHFIIPDSTIFDVMMTVDFFFSDDALNLMVEDFSQADKTPVDINDPLIQESYNDLLGKSEAERVFTNQLLFGSIRQLPHSMTKNFIFNNVKMTYHPDSRSFISHGPVGVGMINGNPVYKYFDGHIQLVRRRSGDELNIYLEVDRGHWYFFNYKGNLMQASSSRSDFNSTLREIKPDKQKIKKGKDNAAYRFVPGESGAKNRFLRNIQQIKSENSTYDE